MMSRMTRLAIFVLTFALVASACGTDTEDQVEADPEPEEAPEETPEDEPEPPEENNVLRLGAALAISGEVSREGNFLRDGYEYWEEHVNERGGIQVGDERYTVEIIYYDDRSDAETGARLTERLITDDNVDFLLGPFSSGIQINTSVVAERHGVLTFAPLANSPDIYERGHQYIFSILPPATRYLDNNLEMAAAQDPPPQTVAIMARDDPFGTAVARGAAATAEGLGLEVVYNEPYPPDSTDLSSPLTTIRDLDPDIFLASTLFADAVLITRQAIDLRVCPDMFALSVGPAIPDYPNELGSDANFVTGAEWWLPTLGWEDDIIGSASDFGEDFEAKYDYTPGYHTASGVAVGVILEKVLERAGTLDADAVREELLAFDEEIFWGPTAWDETGQNTAGASVAVQIQDERIEGVWPPGAATAEPDYPFQCWGDR
jgi:branched-chain amino acid transport system substrate-binding protein